MKLDSKGSGGRVHIELEGASCYLLPELSAVKRLSSTSTRVRARLLAPEFRARLRSLNPLNSSNS